MPRFGIPRSRYALVKSAILLVAVSVILLAGIVPLAVGAADNGNPDIVIPMTPPNLDPNAGTTENIADTVGTTGGDPLSNTLCRVILLLFSGTGRAIASIAIFFMAIGVFAGKVDKWRAIAVGICIALLYGAINIVEWATGYRACEVTEANSGIPITCSGGKSPDTTRNGSCPEGFTGSMTYTCSAKGKWLAPQGNCAPQMMQGPCSRNETKKVTCYHPLTDKSSNLSSHICEESSGGFSKWIPVNANQFNCEYFLGE